MCVISKDAHGTLELPEGSIESPSDFLGIPGSGTGLTTPTGASTPRMCTLPARLAASSWQGQDRLLVVIGLSMGPEFMGPQKGVMFHGLAARFHGLAASPFFCLLLGWRASI